ncbi:hypothetical protein DVH24_030119 [Malus domestica]|uniref:Uncharacterized protein n=1 Tax=Malus domestica TaxID=3750 RepID=A0A498HUX0_MALDO|nr:hypothetical protein DVH24_030119 [Malus domestica]
MPRPVGTAAAPTTAIKRPCPSTKATGAVAQPLKQVKKMTKKGDHTRATIHNVSYPSIAEVSVGTLPDFPPPTADQMATIQPMTQPVDVVDPQLDAAVIGLELGAILVEAVADSTVVAPLSNPKTITPPFILDKEV